MSKSTRPAVDTVKGFQNEGIKLKIGIHVFTKTLIYRKRKEDLHKFIPAGSTHDHCIKISPR